MTPTKTNQEKGQRAIGNQGQGEKRKNQNYAIENNFYHWPFCLSELEKKYQNPCVLKFM